MIIDLIIFRDYDIRANVPKQFGEKRWQRSVRYLMLSKFTSREQRSKFREEG